MMLAVLATLAMNPLEVKVDGAPGSYRLLRGGEPYFVKGVGSSSSDDASLTRLRAAGGNNVRTWGSDNVRGLLDRAQKHGLTVQVGMWLGHVRHGFKWDDAAMLERQREMVRRTVRENKDHPAVLLWALGNEMEIDNDNPTLWKEIEVLAKIVKQEDPTRPVTTITADMNKERAARIRQFAPSIDILGINSYGGLPTLPARLKEYGWIKPYLVTEYGPLGPWEVGKTAWGAEREPTSTQKARKYERDYASSIAGQPGWCLGGHAFIWGHKQEETSTWFGMMLPTGENTEAVDVITRAWSGKYPANRCPAIAGFTLEKDQLGRGEELRATVSATDPEGDPLTYRWAIKAEKTETVVGGDAQTAAEVLHDADGANEIRIAAPKRAGAYRLFVTIRDGKNNAAVANLPFLVR
jgi:hypothetical protein